MVKAQEWLDREYPKEARSRVYQIYLNEPNLEGELDLGGFTYKHDMFGVNIYISSKVNETKLTFKNQGKNIKIIKCVEVQKWLEQNYPSNGTCIRKNERDWGYTVNNFGKTRSEITKLNIRNVGLEGSLVLNDFPNLKSLNCGWNKLTSLDCSNCEQLEVIKCWNNQLISLSLPKHCFNLVKLGISNNNLSNYDCSLFSSFPNLDDLRIGNWDEGKINQNIYNRFFGSLKPLKNLTKLRYSDISNNDIDSGLEYLPESIEEFYCSANLRKDAKCQTLYNLLEKLKGKGFPQKLQGYKQQLAQEKQKARELLKDEFQEKDQKIKELQEKVIQLTNQLNQKGTENNYLHSQIRKIEELVGTEQQRSNIEIPPK